MKFVRIIFYFILSIFVGLFLLVGPGSEAMFSVMANLLGGWMVFLYRASRQITWNLDAVATVVVLSAAILLTAQLAGRSFTSRWSWRWSAMVLGVLLWVFAVTIGSSGLVVSAREFGTTKPMLVNTSIGVDFRMLSEARSFSLALHMADGDAAKFWQSPDQFISGGTLAKMLERYQIILIPGEEHRVDRVVFMHRKEQTRSKSQLLVVIDRPDQAYFRPIAELPNILANVSQTPVER